MRLREMLKTPVLLLAVLAPACGDDDPVGPDPRDVEFAEELGIDLDAMTLTSSGLYFQDVTVGTGATASSGQTVTVLYRGWLPDGTLFDSATNPNNPLPPFEVGVGAVIAGFDEGILGMRVGGVRKLVIPPALGYGNRANGPIPANSILVFEVTLLNVQ